MKLLWLNLNELIERATFGEHDDVDGPAPASAAQFANTLCLLRFATDLPLGRVFPRTFLLLSRALCLAG